jgi:hypothetical protein
MPPHACWGSGFGNPFLPERRAGALTDLVTATPSGHLFVNSENIYCCELKDGTSPARDRQLAAADGRIGLENDCLSRPCVKERQRCATTLAVDVGAIDDVAVLSSSRWSMIRNEHAKNVF